jgi:4-amino-4-deoxy-L-arabinose transferase-like glycosyltransferase
VYEAERRFRVRWVVLLPWLAVVVRALWLANFPPDPIEPIDAEGYHLLARNLLHGNGFSLAWDPPFCPAAIRTPLYPLFLTVVYRLLGAAPLRAVLAQLLLEGLTTALVVRLGHEVGGGRVGAWAGLFYALNGATLRYTSVLYAEIFLIFVLTGALLVTLFALRRRLWGWSAFAGAAWGLAVLTKPNVQYLALAVVGLLALTAWIRRGNWRRVLSLAGALGIVVAPWLVRNRVRCDRWMLSTAFEENLARVSAVATQVKLDRASVAPWTPTWESYYHGIVEATAERYGWDGRPEAALPCAERMARHRQIAATAREVVGTHRGAAVAAHLQGVAHALLNPGHRLWYPVLTERAWDDVGVLTNIWARMAESLRIGAVGDALHALWLERVVRIPPVAGLVWWGLLALRLALIGGVLRGAWRLRRAWSTGLLLLGTVCYFALLPGPIAYDRFLLPLLPAALVLAAVGGLRKHWLVPS